MYHVTDIHSKVSWNLHNGSDSDHNFSRLKVYINANKVNSFILENSQLISQFCNNFMILSNNAVIFNGSTSVYEFLKVFTEIFNKCNFQFHLYIHNNENYFEKFTDSNVGKVMYYLFQEDSNHQCIVNVCNVKIHDNFIKCDMEDLFNEDNNHYKIYLMFY